MAANEGTPEAVGRDHWHHFRVQPNGEKRCHHCDITFDEFAATKNLQVTHEQEKAQA